MAPLNNFMKILAISALIIATSIGKIQTAYAEGLMEIGASYSGRNSRIDDNNYTTTEAWSGSFAWYFMELSALEFSYTRAISTQSVKAINDQEGIKYLQQIDMYGLDLILSLAGRDSFIQPFIRGGGASVNKKYYRESDSTGTQLTGQTNGFQTVPSYGAGIKINLTKTFGIKFSYDRWKSGTTSGGDDTWDDATKAGVSWMF